MKCPDGVGMISSSSFYNSPPLYRRKGHYNRSRSKSPRGHDNYRPKSHDIFDEIAGMSNSSFSRSGNFHNKKHHRFKNRNYRNGNNKYNHNNRKYSTINENEKFYNGQHKYKQQRKVFAGNHNLSVRFSPFVKRDGDETKNGNEDQNERKYNGNKYNGNYNGNKYKQKKLFAGNPNMSFRYSPLPSVKRDAEEISPFKNGNDDTLTENKYNENKYKKRKLFDQSNNFPFRHPGAPPVKRNTEKSPLKNGDGEPNEKKFFNDRDKEKKLFAGDRSHLSNIRYSPIPTKRDSEEVSRNGSGDTLIERKFFKDDVNGSPNRPSKPTAQPLIEKFVYKEKRNGKLVNLNGTSVSPVLLSLNRSNEEESRLERSFNRKKKKREKNENIEPRDSPLTTALATASVTCSTPTINKFRNAIENNNALTPVLVASTSRMQDSQSMPPQQQPETEQNDAEVPIEAPLDPNSPLPLRNLGNTCYMNSVVQSLFTFPFLIDEIKAKFRKLKKLLEEKNEEEKDTAMINAVLGLYEEYTKFRNREDGYNYDAVEERLNDLKGEVGTRVEGFSSGSQQDAVEFFTLVISAIQEEFEKVKDFPPAENPIDRNFEFESRNVYRCKLCGKVQTSAMEKDTALRLCLPENVNENTSYSLAAAIDAYFDAQEADFKCNFCKGSKKMRRVLFTKVPKIMFIQLLRYRENGEKRQEPVNIPHEIEIPCYCYSPSRCAVVPSPLPTPFRTQLNNFSSSATKSPARRRILSESDEMESAIALSLGVQQNGPSNSTNKTTTQPSPTTNEITTNGHANSPKLNHLNDSIQPSTSEANDKTHSVSSTSGSWSVQNNTPQKPQSTPQKSSPLTNGQEENCENFPNEKRMIKYQLMAVVRHLGSSPYGGHYSSFVLNLSNRTWYNCDDEDVRESEWDKVRERSRSSGYCFFYVCKQD